MDFIVFFLSLILFAETCWLFQKLKQFPPLPPKYLPQNIPPLPETSEPSSILIGESSSSPKFQEPSWQICIEILNPLEIAEQKSKDTKMLHKLAPKKVTQKVYEGVIEELKETLPKHGVKVRIRLKEA